MDSNLSEDELLEVMYCDTPVEESESEGTFPMDLTAIPKEHFSWIAVGFRWAALSRQEICRLLSSILVSSTDCTREALTSDQCIRISSGYTRST